MVRTYLALLWVCVFLISQNEVTGAKCQVSKKGWWRCSPCGRGSRCLFCTWCLGFCHKPGKETRNGKQSNAKYGSVEVPYKFPFIEMFKDIETGILADDISEQAVVELYQATSLALREDCEICFDSEEIKKLRDFTMSVHKKLKKLIGSNLFKDTALERTRKAHQVTDKIPESVKTKVDPNSDIIADIPETKLGLVLTGSGGGLAGSPLKLKSSEILHLNGQHRCSLSDFPTETWGHSQNGLTVCGNSDVTYRSNCYEFRSGVWTLTQTLLKPRVYHSSWQSDKGLIMMGGVGIKAQSTSEILSEENISKEMGFSLNSPLRFLFVIC